MSCDTRKLFLYTPEVTAKFSALNMIEKVSERPRGFATTEKAEASSSGVL